MRPFTGNDRRPLVSPASRPWSCSCARGHLAGRSARRRRPACSRPAMSRRLRPFGLGSPLGLAARLELPVLVAWCAGALAAGILVRHHRQGRDGVGAGVGRRHPRQVRRAGQLRQAVLRRRVPARRDGGRAAPREPGRRGGRGGDSRGAWCTCCVRPASRRDAGSVVGSRSRRGRSWRPRRSPGRGMARRGDPGRRRRPRRACWARASNVVPTALVALGIGAVMLALAPRAAVRRRLRRGDLVLAHRPRSPRWSSGTGWLEHALAVPLHGVGTCGRRRSRNGWRHARARGRALHLEPGAVRTAGCLDRLASRSVPHRTGLVTLALAGCAGLVLASCSSASSDETQSTTRPEATTTTAPIRTAPPSCTRRR